MTRTATTSQGECICPHCTADVVSVVLACVKEFGHESVPEGDEQDIVARISAMVSEALSKQLSPGVVLMTTHSVCKQSENFSLFGASPAVAQYEEFPGQRFQSISAAQDSGIRITGQNGEGLRRGRKVNINYGPCFVVTPGEESAGQMSSPRRFAHAVEEIEGAWRSAQMSDPSAFLETLRDGCLNAHRAGVSYAGVAIQNHGEKMLLEPLNGPSEKDCEEQAQHISPGSTCVCIRVYSHDKVGS